MDKVSWKVREILGHKANDNLVQILSTILLEQEYHQDESGF